MSFGATPILHASCVAVEGRALLITGASGKGKSSLALALMALGAVLVADDKVLVTVGRDGLWAEAPDRLKGFIEARGLGILRASACDRALVVAVVDLDKTAKDRLPRKETTLILGCELPLLHRVDNEVFAPALVQFLKGGMVDPDGEF